MRFELTHRSGAVPEPSAAVAPGIVGRLSLSVAELQQQDDLGHDSDLRGYLEHAGVETFIDAVRFWLPEQQGSEHRDSVLMQASRANGSAIPRTPEEVAGYVLTLFFGGKSEAYFIASVDRDQVKGILSSLRDSGISGGIERAALALARACEVLGLNVLPV